MTPYVWHELNHTPHAVVRDHFLEPIEPGDEVTTLFEKTKTVDPADGRLSQNPGAPLCLTCYAAKRELGEARARG